MIRRIYKVHDVEHPGDYGYFATAIRNGGGTVDNITWSGEDGEPAYISYHVETPQQLAAVYNSIPNAE